MELSMRTELRSKIIEVCDKKIAQKGDNVGLSFYAFSLIKMITQSYLWKRQLGGFKHIN